MKHRVLSLRKENAEKW